MKDSLPPPAWGFPTDYPKRQGQEALVSGMRGIQMIRHPGEALVIDSIPEPVLQRHNRELRMLDPLIP